MIRHDVNILHEVQALIEKIDALAADTVVFHQVDLNQAVKDVQREALHAIVNHIQSHFHREAFGLEPMIKEADPELERLLAEEEEIERQIRGNDR